MDHPSTTEFTEISTLTALKIASKCSLLYVRYTGGRIIAKLDNHVELMWQSEYFDPTNTPTKLPAYPKPPTIWWRKTR